VHVTCRWTLAIAAVCALALALAGCAAQPKGTAGGALGAPTASASTTTAGVDSGRVLHIVARIVRGRPRRESVEDVQMWLDPGRGLKRMTWLARDARGVVYMDQRELVRGAVATTHLGIDTSGGGRLQWTADERDADAGALDGWADPSDDLPIEKAIWRGDLDVYRRMVAAHEATTTGSVSASGSPAYRLLVPTPLGGMTQGGTTTVDVRQSDYLPIRTTRTSWYMDTGKRHDSPPRTVDYDVIEWVERGRVPTGTFELAIPEGFPLEIDRTITVKEAASFVPVQAWWLGASYDGLDLDQGALRYRSAPPRPTGMAWVGSFPTPLEMADAGRPDLSGPSVEVLYGTEGGRHVGSDADVARSIKVISFPRVLREKWSFHPGIAVSHVTVGGQDALLGTQTWRYGNNSTVTTWQVGYLALDVGSATVILQGVKVTPAELERAAAALRRVR
jgi:hypothetical protein